MLIDLEQDADGEDRSGFVPLSPKSLLSAMNLYRLDLLTMSSVYRLAKYLCLEKRMVLASTGAIASYPQVLTALAKNFRALVSPPPL